LNVRIFKLLRLPLAFALLVLPLAGARGQGAEPALLPAQVGDFRAAGARDQTPPALEPLTPESFAISSYEGRQYAAPDGRRFDVFLVNTASTSAAYSYLTFSWPGKLTPYRFGHVRGLGFAGVSGGGTVKFVNGTSYVHVSSQSGPADGQEAVLEFARLLARALGGGEGEHPVLVLHLPEWEKKVSERVGFPGVNYAVSLPALQEIAGHRPALDALSFEGGAEAATAAYEGGRLVVVEFSTPQHSVDADAAVSARINELRAAGEPVPSAYRREGNYSVFVFDAPEAAAAEQLASGVKYEKDVRWLGRDPHAEDRAVKHYTSTMGGVIVATLVTTGAAILICLGVGGLIGGLVFLRRRARNDEQEVYSDAGGMLRLNLEDLNTPPTTAQLLGPGKE
jgi:hypothetical protein